MEKILVDKEKLTEEMGIVIELPMEETELEEQEVVLWEELMKE